jgi:serine/threonine-protein kinase
MAENEPVVTAPHGLAGTPEKAGGAARERAPGAARRCSSCQQHFTGDARFCPFDGGALEAAPEYRSDADPLIGTLIDGRYQVESVLGEGGMGIVYGARHRSLDKRFALKVMRAHMARDGELAARFTQEARAAAAIHHPNIVQITDFGDLPIGAPYFVMELLDGVPLSQLLKCGGPPPFARALRIVKQVAAALAAAHAVGVVHRDLKPDNIHITSYDVVKVLDFGVAKVAGAGRLTRTGMVYGTPHYMSPEQASGDNVDHRADLYALGIIMYEMFAGRVPFEADSYMGVLTKHMFMLPEPPSRVNAAVRELGALEEVILKCLEKKPDARYPSMDALIAEIESIARIGAGDQLEILRLRLQSGATPPINLADELEPPAREEMGRWLRSSAVPGTFPLRLVLGSVAVAILGFGIAYALLRAWSGEDGERARPVPVLAPTVLSAEPPIQAPLEPATVVAEPTAAPATTPAPTGAGGSAAHPHSGRERPIAPRATPAHPDPARGRRTEPAPAGSGFGSGDIVNPWAQ